MAKGRAGRRGAVGDRWQVRVDRGDGGGRDRPGHAARPLRRTPVQRFPGLGAGAPLDGATRAFMEPRLHADLGAVRVHTGAGADLAARSLGADAFAVGSDVAFRSGRYEPATSAGRRALVHELAHVVQHQRGAVAPARGPVPRVSDPADPEEVAAERVANEVAGAASGAHGGAAALRALSDGPAARGPVAGQAAGPVVLRKATKVPLPFVGGRWFNDSAVTFTPSANLWVGGAVASSTDFPDGTVAEVRIRAGTSGAVVLECRVSVFEDNRFINESWHQRFWVSWPVSATPAGVLTIDSTSTPTVLSPDETNAATGLSAIDPANGTDFVQVSPRISSAGASGGFSFGVELGGNYSGSFLQQPFTVFVRVTDIPTAAPSTTYATSAHFERPGQWRLSRDTERFLIGWYEGLPADVKRAVATGAVQVELVGKASTTGGEQDNRRLADRRAAAVAELLRQYVGSDVNVRTRAVGEYQATTADDVEEASERAVQVQVRYTPEP